jgi:hypothetical protein
VVNKLVLPGGVGERTEKAVFSVGQMALPVKTDLQQFRKMLTERNVSQLLRCHLATKCPTFMTQHLRHLASEIQSNYETLHTTQAVYIRVHSRAL